MVGDIHFGNLFMGQFFFEDEPLDYELFRSQARQYRFDEQEYIAALEAVPRMSRETLSTSMHFFMKLADILSKQSYSNLKLARSLAESDALMEELRKSQQHNEFLANILEISSQPFGVGYPDGRLGLINDAYERLTGYTEDELRSMNWTETLTPPEWREFEREKLEELHRTGRPVRFEKEYIRKDGSRVPVELLVHLATDAEGNPAYYYSFVTDITERKKAAEEICRSEERYRSLFNSLIEGFCIIEMLFDADERPIDYRFLEINPAFEAQTGLRNAQGKLMRELAPEHEAHWFEIYGNVALTGEPACFVNEAKALNRWFNVCAYRVGEQDSRKVAILFSDITEAKLADEALRESRERLDLALASSRMATFDWDIVKNKRTWSDGVHSLLGTKPETFTGTGEEFFRIMHPDDRGSVKANLDKAVETTGVYDTEYRAVWPDGSIHYISARGKVLYDDSGRAVLLTGVCWDITERKRAEERLWAQARTLKALNSGIHALLHATDELSLLQAVCKTVVEDCGHAMVWIGFAEEDEEKSVRPVASAGFEEGYLETLGISWADTDRGRGPTGVAIRMGKPCGCSDMLSDPAFEPWRNEAIKRGYASSLVLPLLNDGKVLGALSIYSPKTNAFSEEEAVLLMQLADELAYGISTVRLRVAHDQAYEELRQAKDEWELTFNSVPDLIAILNDRHQVVRVNRAMAERLGREPEECMGMPCYEAVHGSNLPPEFCPHTKTMNDGGEHKVEVSEERLGGDYLVSTTPLLDLQGHLTGTVHVARDITERKRAEEELRRAKEAAEASTLAKSQFLANMSHELRTPMTGVIGMLDLVLSGNIEAEQKEFIEIAQKSASSLVRILNDILDLTKIEAGKFAIEEKAFSLRECVEDTVSLLLPSALSKGLDLNFTVADDVPEILVADHLRLGQVLTNLVGNAVKFTEKGQVEIRVTADSRAADGKGEVTFTVADTGVGIPDGKKHLLFQVFSQVDDSHSRIYGGTGLGLAISKEIVERMGGTITFTSEEGKGSTFSCTIPLGEAHEAERIDIVASVKTPLEGEAPRAETAIPHLLVAEDDSTIRQVLGLMLQRSNFTVNFAESGQEAVDIWENGQFDLILMDVQMPGMNGFEATAAIREKERTRGGHTPIIAMTAHALKEDEERCFAAGMDYYISKPIDFKKSLELIKDLIANKGHEIQH